MGSESDLLRRIQTLLGRADLEVDDLVDEAWQAARAEVRTVLQRAFQQELLSRVAQVVESSEPAAGPSTDSAGTEEPAADNSPRPEQTSAPATYLFGITQVSAALDGDLPRVPGGGPVRAVDHGALRAVVCDADADALRRLEALDANDLDFLADAAHAHDEVLARVAARAPVVPLRLGTLVADDAVVTALLESNATSLRAELERVDGHAEWAVVVRIADHGGEPAPSTAAASGGDYLRQRQASLSARERRWEAKERLADAVHERLSVFAVAAETVEQRPLEQVPPALHGVYLLPWEAIEPFEEAVEEARAAHPEAIIEATGPWPAYHFTSIDLSVGGQSTP